MNWFKIGDEVTYHLLEKAAKWVFSSLLNRPPKDEDKKEPPQNTEEKEQKTDRLDWHLIINNDEIMPLENRQILLRTLDQLEHEEDRDRAEQLIGVVLTQGKDGYFRSRSQTTTRKTTRPPKGGKGAPETVEETTVKESYPPGFEPEKLTKQFLVDSTKTESACKFMIQMLLQKSAKQKAREAMQEVTEQAKKSFIWLSLGWLAVIVGYVSAIVVFGVAAFSRFSQAIEHPDQLAPLGWGLLWFMLFSWLVSPLIKLLLPKDEGMFTERDIPRIVGVSIASVLLLTLMSFIGVGGFARTGVVALLVLSFFSDKFGGAGKWVRIVFGVATVIAFLLSWKFTAGSARSIQHRAEEQMPRDNYDPKKVDTPALVRFYELPDGTIRRVTDEWVRNPVTGEELAKPGTDEFLKILTQYEIQEAKKKAAEKKPEPLVVTRPVEKYPCSFFIEGTTYSARILGPGRFEVVSEHRRSNAQFVLVTAEMGTWEQTYPEDRGAFEFTNPDFATQTLNGFSWSSSSSNIKRPMSLSCPNLSPLIPSP